MNMDAQIEAARGVAGPGFDNCRCKTGLQPVNCAQVVGRINAMWEQLGTPASEPDCALQRALERIRHAADETEILSIGCDALGNYNRGATLEFAQLAHLTARAADSQGVDDELPTALRQAARQALHSYLALPELDEEFRRRAAPLLREIEREQILS
jgi:hypothetical protein